MGMWNLGASEIPPEKDWGISTPQNLTHTMNHHYWGERSTHNKWDSKEEMIWYNQYWRTYCNTTGNINWGSGTQLWQPSPDQNIHCMVQPQETMWRCTAHEKKTFLHNLRLIIPGVGEIGSWNGSGLSSMDITLWGEIRERCGMGGAIVAGVGRLGSGALSWALHDFPLLQVSCIENVRIEMATVIKDLRESWLWRSQD